MSSFLRQEPCPNCGSPATIEYARFQVEETGALPPRPTGAVACTNAECERYQAPPRQG
jgi:hypothetical protein